MSQVEVLSQLPSDILYNNIFLLFRAEFIWSIVSLISKVFLNKSREWLRYYTKEAKNRYHLSACSLLYYAITDIAPYRLQSIVIEAMLPLKCRKRTNTDFIAFKTAYSVDITNFVTCSYFSKREIGVEHPDIYAVREDHTLSPTERILSKYGQILLVDAGIVIPSNNRDVFRTRKTFREGIYPVEPNEELSRGDYCFVDYTDSSSISYERNKDDTVLEKQMTLDRVNNNTEMEIEKDLSLNTTEENIEDKSFTDSSYLKNNKNLCKRNTISLSVTNNESKLIKKGSKKHKRNTRKIPTLAHPLPSRGQSEHRKRLLSNRLYMPLYMRENLTTRIFYVFEEVFGLPAAIYNRMFLGNKYFKNEEKFNSDIMDNNDILMPDLVPKDKEGKQVNLLDEFIEGVHNDSRILNIVMAGKLSSPINVDKFLKENGDFVMLLEDPYLNSNEQSCFTKFTTVDRTTGIENHTKLTIFSGGTYLAVGMSDLDGKKSVDDFVKAKTKDYLIATSTHKRELEVNNTAIDIGVKLVERDYLF